MKLEGVPEGYEAVRFGSPVFGEWFVRADGTTEQAIANFDASHWLIVRKLQPVLDLSKVRLKKGWIAQDKNLVNCWYEHKPRLDEDAFSWIGCVSGDFETLTSHVIDIPWRADVPWTERIMEIPE